MTEHDKFCMLYGLHPPVYTPPSACDQCQSLAKAREDQNGIIADFIADSLCWTDSAGVKWLDVEREGFAEDIRKFNDRARVPTARTRLAR